MNRVPIIALILTATALDLIAAPRVALVRVRDIYSGLPSTEALQRSVKEEQDTVMKDQRAIDLRRIIADLQDLQSRLSDKANPPDEETGRKLAQAYEIKRQEAQTLQREFEQFRSDLEKSINRRMIGEMRASLNRIHEISQRLAKERGYDLMLDSSGNTNTGVPFVLYAKDAPDLTEDVIAALQDTEAAAAAAREAEEAKMATPDETVPAVPAPSPGSTPKP